MTAQQQPQSMSWLLAGGAVARDLLEALFASVDDAIYMVDPDGSVRVCNPAALRILGYDDAAELVGKPSHQTIHYQHRDGTPYPVAECPMLRPRQTGETVRVELDWFTRKDGRMVPVAYSSAPLATDRGRGAVVVFRDVSERLASEETARREAEERARAEELDASRGRILAAMDAERRRLGRDLHDGAQQRLLHVLLLLGDGKAALEGRGGDCSTILERATAEVRSAIDDVRQLAAGIHPAILTARGLGAAIESITARVPVPVDVDIPADRFAEPIEIASDAPAAVRSQVAAVAASLGVPTSLIDDPAPRSEPIAQKCGPQVLDPTLWENDDYGRDIGCGPPFRGGIHVDAHDSENCTAGFNVQSRSDGKPYVMTAGHCYEMSDIGRIFYARNSANGSDPIGPLHNRYYVRTRWALSMYEDAAIITVDDARHPERQLLRPWIVAGNQSQVTNPQFEIQGVGYSWEGKTLCFSGAISGGHCGTVEALGKARGHAGYIRMCPEGSTVGKTRIGDSGGPFFSVSSSDGGLAHGMLTGVPKREKPCISQYSSAASDAAKMNVDFVSTANTGNDGSHHCDSGWMWIDGQGCLLIL